MSPYLELEEYAKKQYGRMRQRFSTRYPWLELPFTRVEFIEWLHSILREGITHCAYCDWPVSLDTMHLDHRYPVCQGGSLELFNLAPACAECNAQKGELTEGAFLELRALISNDPKFQGVTSCKFTEHDCTDIKARLQSQLKLARWKQRQLRNLAKVKIVPHQREVGP